MNIIIDRIIDVLAIILILTVLCFGNKDNTKEVKSYEIKKDNQ